MWIRKDHYQDLRYELRELRKQNLELVQALLDARGIPATVSVESNEGRVSYMDDDAVVELENAT